MRYYPTSDVFFYVDLPNRWDLYCRNPNKSFRLHKDLKPVDVIPHWRDLDGLCKEIIKDEDLYFPDWQYTRIRPQACLPLYYAVGNRYIKLQKAYPAGFKCAPLPMNIREVRAVKEWEKQQRKREKAMEKALAAMMANQKGRPPNKP